jgi:L-amino acid N-acyltransferase YncA
MEFQIRSMLDEDWEQVKRIYLHGIVSGNATFETSVPTWEHWNSNHLKQPRLIAVSRENTGEFSRISGWAALSPVSTRKVYAGVAEVSVYIDPTAQGRGLGGMLLAELILQSEQAGLWTLQAGILAENTASVRLHQKHGFRVVGTRERIAQLNGEWRDTILMERRSPLF